VLAKCEMANELIIILFEYLHKV